MGKRLEEKVAHLVHHGNRRRLSQLFRKHPALLRREQSEVLHTAYWMNRAMLQWLLAKGINPNSRMPGGNTVLMCAVADGDTASAKLLIEYGADVEATNQEGETPLGFAVAYEHPDAIRVLVAHGANIDGTEGTGRTYLEWAEMSGWRIAAETLRSLRPAKARAGTAHLSKGGEEPAADREPKPNPND